MERDDRLGLLKDTLEEAGEYIQRLKDNKHLAVEPLLKGNYSEALKQIISLIDGLAWLCQVLDRAGEILQLPKGGHDQQTKELNDYLKKVTEAMEQEDYVLLGDLLEYGLDQSLDNYSEVFLQIRTRCEAGDWLQ